MRGVIVHSDVYRLRISWVTLSRMTTVINSYLRTPVFVSCYKTCFFFVPPFICVIAFFFQLMPYFVPSFLNVTVIHHNVFIRAVQSYQLLALSRLMHIIHTAATLYLKMAVFWVVATCRLLWVCHRFRGLCYLHEYSATWRWRQYRPLKRR
jgi:hypothetical protein